MFETISKHKLYYFSFLIILILGLSITYRVSFDKELQKVALISTAVGYVFWGLFHHLIKHDLDLKIVIEYILVAVLGLATALFFFKGI